MGGGVRSHSKLYSKFQIIPIGYKLTFSNNRIKLWLKIRDINIWLGYKDIKGSCLHNNMYT